MWNQCKSEVYRKIIKKIAKYFDFLCLNILLGTMKIFRSVDISWSKNVKHLINTLYTYFDII